jgi:hypothetical protein
MEPLEDLLDQAATALVSGDLVALETLAPRIEQSAGQILQQDRAILRRLRDKATRNARLLEAATRGVKSARMRVTEIARGPTLTTYDARGHKAAIATTGAATERRV